MIASRRRFLFGAGAFLAAPAIVRVASIMPLSVPKLTIGHLPPTFTSEDDLLMAVEEFSERYLRPQMRRELRSCHHKTQGVETGPGDRPFAHECKAGLVPSGELKRVPPCRRPAQRRYLQR